MIKKKAWLLFKKQPLWIVLFWLSLFFLLLNPWAWGAKVQLEIKIDGETLLQEVSLLSRGTQSLVAVEELFPEIGGISYYSPIMKKVRLVYKDASWTIALDKGEAVSESGEVLKLEPNQVVVVDHTVYVDTTLLEQFFGWQVGLQAQVEAPSSVTPSPPEVPKTPSLPQTASSQNLLAGVRFYTHRDQGKTRVTLDFSKEPPLHEMQQNESRVSLYLNDCDPRPGIGELIKIEDGRVGDVRVSKEAGRTVVHVSLEKPVKVVKGVLGGSKPRIFLDIMDLAEPGASTSEEVRSEPGVEASEETKSEPEQEVEKRVPVTETLLPEDFVNLNVIVIDPGHGGKDPGCVQNGYREKDIVLAISLKLKKALEEKGFQVYLTRDSDVYPSLSERMQVANTRRPFAFLSIHCNAAPVPSARGVEIFVGDARYRGEGAQEVAARENRLFQQEVASGRNDKYDKALSSGFYLKSREVAAELACLLLSGITGRTGQLNRELKTAPLIVLSDVLFPACLVEVGFLSNPAEAKNLASPAFQDRLVQGMVEGIVAFHNSSKLKEYISGNGQ
jgi:N-acetylmuramoyl-L-alanine amidase